MRKTATIGVGIIVGVGLLWFAFRDVPFSDLFSQMSEMNLIWLVPLLLIPVIDLVIRGWRWRQLLSPIADVPTSRAFQILAVGLAMNNLILMRIGEFARAVIGAREFGAPTVSVFATVVIERFCDLAAMLLLFAVIGGASSGIVDVRFAWFAAFGGLGIVALLWAGAMIGEGFLKSRWAEWLNGYPRVNQFAQDLVLGVRALRDPVRAGGIAVASLLVWFANAGTYWFASRAIEAARPLDIVESVSCLTVAAAGVALPSMPGAFGNFEAAVKMSLVHFGYDKATALALAAFLHIITYCVMTGIGVLCFYRLGLTFSGVRGALKEKTSE